MGPGGQCCRRRRNGAIVSGGGIGPVAVLIETSYPALGICLGEALIGVAVPLGKAAQVQIGAADRFEQFVQQHRQFGYTIFDGIEFGLLAQFDPQAVAAFGD